MRATQAHASGAGAGAGAGARTHLFSDADGLCLISPVLCGVAFGLFGVPLELHSLHTSAHRSSMCFLPWRGRAQYPHIRAVYT